MNDLTDYLSVADCQPAYPNLVRNQDSLRWIVRHRDENGLAKSKAVVKRQGRIFLHVGRFAGWMQNGGEEQHAA